jgi:DNA-binding GntR family transcriptional regulator
MQRQDSEGATHKAAHAKAQSRASHVGYREISNQLIGDIHAGEWKVGEKLPTEAALVERFGVSRNTVREALREIRDLGYLSKRRGTASVIVRTSAEPGFINSIRTVEELVEYASGAHNTLLSSERIIVMEEQAKILDSDPGREWQRLQILRRREADSTPFCYSEIFVDPLFVEAIKSASGLAGVYSAIEENCGVVIGRVVQEIEAAAATANIALRLQIPVDSPILRARTTFYSQAENVVEIGVAHFAAGRYRLRIALDRQRAKAG